MNPELHLLIEQSQSGDASLITPVNTREPAWALRASGNPLSDDWNLPEPGHDTIISWSGSLADDLFKSHPLTWMAPGHDALARFCDAIAPALRAQDRRLVFHPHARHVLSDPPSVFNFLTKRGEQPFDVLLSPAEMLEPSMLETIEDHLVRMFETLGGRCAGLVMHDVIVDGERASCSAAPLGDGLLPAPLIRRLIADNCPPELPVILMPNKVDQQQEWLT